MIKTYNLLKKSISNNFISVNGNKSNDELAVIYQKTKDEQIPAYIYCRNFNYWVKVSKMINFIEYDDIASIILEKIVLGLKTFNPDFHASLLTYIYVNIYNEFGRLKTNRKYKGRIIDSSLLNLDMELCDEGTLADVLPADDTDLQTTMLKITIDTDRMLTPKEKQLCHLIIDNPSISVNELGAEMKVTTMYIWILKKNLAKKLKISLCLD